MTLRTLFSEASLQRVRLAVQDVEKNDVAFEEFQQDLLSEAFSPFTYDRCIVRIFELDEDGKIQIQRSTCFGFDADTHVDSSEYADHINSDPLLRLAFHNPGRLFCHSDVHQEDPLGYEKKLHFQDQYGIHKKYTVCYTLPENDDLFFSIEFLFGKNNQFWDAIAPADLEYASFLFALAWLVRYKRIGRINFERNIASLSGMTLKKLQKLRRYVNRKPGEGLKGQAKSLGLKLTGYDSALYTIRDSFYERFQKCRSISEPQNDKSTSKNLEILDSRLYLLKLMHDPTRPIIVPAGVRLTMEFFERWA